MTTPASVFATGSASRRALPKSTSAMVPSSRNITFAGLRSRWMMPAGVHRHQRREDRADDDEGFLDRGPVARHARAQVARGEVFHDDVGVAVGEAMLEHLGDVRAVDARGGEIFLHEARQQVGIAAAFGLENLEHHLLLVAARSHRQTLAVAPLPRGLTGVKPWMPADLSTDSASASRRASTRAIMLGLSSGGLGPRRRPCRLVLRHRLDVGGRRAGSRSCAPASAAPSRRSRPAALCRPGSGSTRTIFGKLGLARSSDSHSRPSLRRYSSSMSRCA